jgi:hypothetical protein
MRCQDEQPRTLGVGLAPVPNPRLSPEVVWVS